MRPPELISQLIILYLEQASGQSDKKWHSAEYKVENRTLLEMIKIYGRGGRGGRGPRIPPPYAVYFLPRRTNPNKLAS